MGHNLPTFPYHRPIIEPDDSSNRIFCANSFGTVRPDPPGFLKFHCSEGRTPSCNVISIHDQRQRNATGSPKRDQRYSASSRFRLFEPLLDSATLILRPGTHSTRLAPTK